MSRQALQVSGLTCNGCERVVEEELSSLYGVSEVEADHREGVVEFSGDEQTAEKAADHLTQIGYDADA